MSGRAESVGRQPHQRRFDDGPEAVAARRDPNHARTLLHWPSPQLRPAEIHRDARASTVAALRPPDVLDHLAPHGGVVVRAVDTGDVHAARRHRGNRQRLTGGIARQGDHDPRGARPRKRTEQRLGVRLQQVVSLGMADASGTWGWLVAVQPGKHRQHRFDRRENMGLGSPEGGQPDRREARLEIAHVVAAELEIVHEVRRRPPVRRMRRGDVGRTGRLGGDHRVAHGSDISFEMVECTVGARCLHNVTVWSASEYSLNRGQTPRAHLAT